MHTEPALNSGHLHLLKPGKALNKAFLKVKPNQGRYELVIHNGNKGRICETRKSPLEAEIDQFFYRLYGLNEEETRIVEGSVGKRFYLNYKKSFTHL